MASVASDGMESRFSEYGINANCIAWNQDRRGTENKACRLMPCADEPRCHTKPKALIPYQALRSWIVKKSTRESALFYMVRQSEVKSNTNSTEED